MQFESSLNSNKSLGDINLGDPSLGIRRIAQPIPEISEYARVQPSGLSSKPMGLDSISPEDEALNAKGNEKAEQFVDTFKRFLMERQQDSSPVEFVNLSFNDVIKSMIISGFPSSGMST